MKKQKPIGSIELEIERITGIQEQISRNAQHLLEALDTALLRTGDALLFNVTGSDEYRDEMVVHNQALMKAEREVVTVVVEMAGVLAAFLIKPYESGVFQPDIIPTHFNQLGRHWEYSTTGSQKYAATAEQVALLSGYCSSESNPMIGTCCDSLPDIFLDSSLRSLDRARFPSDIQEILL